MNGINAKFFDILEIGDDHPTVFMGVLNLSPESFYSGSVYEDSKSLEDAVSQMVDNGAKMLDLGARSTAPWSKKITVEEELRRIVPAMENLCKIIPDDVVITIDTQYSMVAKKTHDISLKYGKKIIINDVSCLKTDPTLADFIIEAKLPIILMASKKLPGDICNVEEMINEFTITIESLKSKGYDERLIILDPGIGKWIKEKTYEYDLKIIDHLKSLESLRNHYSLLYLENPS